MIRKIILIATTFLIVAPAFAQNLEEIVVTAQRRTRYNDSAPAEIVLPHIL